MLISAVRYTRGLDLEARVYAETTGIAMGWLVENVFRCGCWVCEFVVEERLEVDFATTERSVHKKFFRLVERHKCLHWPKYLRYKEAPNEEVQIARQTLKRADEKSLARKYVDEAVAESSLEDVPWELQPEAEKVADAGVAALEEEDFLEEIERELAEARQKVPAELRETADAAMNALMEGLADLDDEGFEALQKTFEDKEED